MYAIAREAFEGEIAKLLNGRFGDIGDVAVGDAATQIVTCPACPPNVQ